MQIGFPQMCQFQSYIQETPIKSYRVYLLSSGERLSDVGNLAWSVVSFIIPFEWLVLESFPEV